MKKVLLTTPVGPYDTHYYNHSLTDAMDQRFSRGCGIFTLRGHTHINFAHVVAQNIAAHTIFLEYPRWEDFDDELKCCPEIVGINGFHNQRDIVIEMCWRVRKIAPNAKIIIGGWAAVAVQSVVPEAQWKEYADALCLSDGIEFMRRELGEDLHAPISISHLPKWGSELPWLEPHPVGDNGVVVASLGCPRACNFCGTTHMYKFKMHRLLSPEQTFTEFKRYYREESKMRFINLIEEDSFADVSFMRRLGELIQEDREFGLEAMAFYCLASNQSLSQWDFDDILKTGVSYVFVGVESKFAPEQDYDKTQGRTIDETFRELERRGISTVGAWMCGFDFQNRNNIEEDLQHFVSLEPTFQQLARVCPFPGTRLWEMMRDEGRIDPQAVPSEAISFFGGGGLAPQNFYEHEVMEILERGYVSLYEVWGASVFRYFKVLLNGFEYCSNHGDPLIQRRAEYHRKWAFETFPLLLAMDVYAPNSTVRKRIRDERARYIRLLGRPTKPQLFLEKIVLKEAGKAMKRELHRPVNMYPKEEPFKRYEYHGQGRNGKCPYEVTYPHREYWYPFYCFKRWIRNRFVSCLLRPE